MLPGRLECVVPPPSPPSPTAAHFVGAGIERVVRPLRGGPIDDARKYRTSTASRYIRRSASASERAAASDRTRNAGNIS